MRFDTIVESVLGVYKDCLGVPFKKGDSITFADSSINNHPLWNESIAKVVDFYNGKLVVKMNGVYYLVDPKYAFNSEDISDWTIPDKVVKKLFKKSSDYLAEYIKKGHPYFKARAIKKKISPATKKDV